MSIVNYGYRMTWPHLITTQIANHRLTMDLRFDADQRMLNCQCPLRAHRPPPPHAKYNHRFVNATTHQLAVRLFARTVL